MCTNDLSTGHKTFDNQILSFKELIHKKIQSSDTSTFNKQLSHFDGEKGIIDQAFRELLNDLLAANTHTFLENLLSLSIDCAEKNFCSIHLPVTLLSDLFDCLTLDQCEELFSWVEDRVDFWKKEFFFNTCKNRILRTCNDLLRRLSRSQNMVFCGRTLVFLAKIFPLSERSGLNINSEFNIENITHFSSQDDLTDIICSSKDETMEEGEMKETTNSITVNYNLYRKFWSLQEFFRQPNLCYSKISWRRFSSYSADVLAAFSSYKLDDVESGMKTVAKANPLNCYFAKYLTSQKLLELEMSDGNFRRFVLIQFLILFQYLQSSAKSRHESYVLTEDQLIWIKDSTEKIFKLLQQTPPNGILFAKSIQMILKREEYWNNWKNDGCPSFHSVQINEEGNQPPKKRPRLGDMLEKAAANNDFMVGTPELNKLWNLHPDNWEICKSESRNYMPSLDSYFKQAIEQTDPSSDVEERHKVVNDINFGWRALRLLSHKSPLFFLCNNSLATHDKTLPSYLSSMVTKLAKEIPLSTSAAEEEAADMGEESEDEILKNTDETIPKEEEKAKCSSPVNPLTDDETLVGLATLIEGQWKALASNLKFQEDEIQYFEDEHPDPLSRAKYMLSVWLEQDNATIPALQSTLNTMDLQEAASYLENL